MVKRSATAEDEVLPSRSRSSKTVSNDSPDTASKSRRKKATQPQADLPSSSFLPWSWQVKEVFAGCLLVALGSLLTLVVLKAVRTGSSRSSVVQLSATDLSSRSTSVSVTESICGRKWQEEYAELHRNILKGQAPQRYLVDAAIGQGLGDRLIGLASLFYVAVLSKRAFQVMSLSGLPGIDLAFNSSGPNIQWLRKEEPPEDVRLAVKAHFTKTNATNSSWDVWPMFLNNKRAQQIPDYEESDVRAFPPGAESESLVFVTSNASTSYRTFRNPIVVDQLQNWDLTPDTSLFCALDFLLRPNDQVKNTSHLLITEMSDRKALKIGIHIFVEDPVLQLQGSVNVKEVAGSFFQCAQMIESRMVWPGQKVIWYVISNSLEIRRQAKLTYGDKVLTDVDSGPQLANISVDPKPCEKNAAEQAMMGAISEIIAFSKADVHIGSRRSGLSKVGAWMAPHPPHIYITEMFTKANCEFASQAMLASEIAGV